VVAVNSAGNRAAIKRMEERSQGRRRPDKNEGASADHQKTGARPRLSPESPITGEAVTMFQHDCLKEMSRVNRPPAARAGSACPPPAAVVPEQSVSAAQVCRAQHVADA